MGRRLDACRLGAFVAGRGGAGQEQSQVIAVAKLIVLLVCLLWAIGGALMIFNYLSITSHPGFGQIALGAVVDFGPFLGALSLFAFLARRSQQYRITSTLYSQDGKRAAEVREFRSGATYLLERERVDASTFKDRHSGRMVGPFASPVDAENFIVATTWFRGATTDSRTGRQGRARR